MQNYLAEELFDLLIHLLNEYDCLLNIGVSFHCFLKHSYEANDFELSVS